MDRLETEIENHRMKAVMCEMVGANTEAKKEWYLHDCLSLLKNIQDSGDCNVCARHKDCRYAPNWGQMVRYNCPFYLKTLKEGDKDGEH